MRDVVVTGGTGFLGAEVLRVLRREWPGRVVRALARSDRSAEAVAAHGAIPVRGDLTAEGPWQEVVAGAEVVVHAAQPPAWGRKVTAAVARGWEEGRLAQERRLLGAASAGARVVYVSGSSWFGHTGAAPGDETMTPAPCGWGPYLERPQAQARALASERGFDLVMAYPSAVYGPGSWFAQSVLKPLARGKRLLRIAGTEPWFSPIHVEDCARALVHLAVVDQARLDAVGRDVLLVDDRPIPASRLAALAAEALGTTARTLPIPGFVVRLLAGEVVRSYLASRAVYRNDRLKALGFELRWPTAEQGVPDVVRRWLEERRARAPQLQAAASSS